MHGNEKIFVVRIWTGTWPDFGLALLEAKLSDMG